VRQHGRKLRWGRIIKCVVDQSAPKGGDAPNALAPQQEVQPFPATFFLGDMAGLQQKPRRVKPWLRGFCWFERTSSIRGGQPR